MPLLVGRSRLEVGAERAKFPTVSGCNLNRQELEFPRDFRGRSQSVKRAASNTAGASLLIARVGPSLQKLRRG
jgi:hypothetical protein